MPAVYFYNYPPASEDETCDIYYDDDDKSTFYFLAGLNYDTHISLLKSLVRTIDPIFWGIVIILCDRVLPNDSTIMRLSYTYAYHPYMKFHTTWLWANGYIPIKNYRLYFLLFCFIISILRVYYNWLGLSYYWKKCLSGSLCMSFIGVDFVVRIALGYLFFIFFMFTVFAANVISIFCGVNYIDYKFPAFFFIKLLNTIFCLGGYLVYFITSTY